MKLQAGRHIKIILSVSILLNVLLIGLIGGGGFRVLMHPHPDRAFQRELAALPPNVRAGIDKTFEASRNEMRGLHRAMKQMRQEVRGTLNADPFVREDYDAAVAKLNQVRTRMMQVRAEKTGEIAENLSAENRRKFAGYLLRGGRKGGFKGAPSSPPGAQEHTQRQNPVEPSAKSPPSVPTQKAPQKSEEPFDPVMLPIPDF